MAEFFGRKPTIEEIQKLLSPAGFLSELQYKDYEDEYLVKDLNQWGMPKEIGFKVKGPEPTRFGDWERKGRCTDF
ncbi:hypothetical protein IMG5_133290 [Ichthyophthirius multifiliis]|uniref:Succinate dehydrogenase assembly factor 4, mitochondrial n=1 Tax=Ichthyophthirius multifiliis TaxID=5932 RepID=G0QWL7_ICHMU|nr:hypothetical protein IMG5_133290 [Ichthyophthirius multifiliis]EGR30392.1 hypothetical protein IMG5_133290 [Ichthyophthirius multifiliis]|eukprot:XP_004031979.1 hypothetical protein IMG5_133290 [Ichthyophthirius multifiliis]